MPEFLGIVLVLVFIYMAGTVVFGFIRFLTDRKK